MLCGFVLTVVAFSSVYTELGFVLTAVAFSSVYTELGFVLTVAVFSSVNTEPGVVLLYGVMEFSVYRAWVCSDCCCIQFSVCTTWTLIPVPIIEGFSALEMYLLSLLLLLFLVHCVSPCM